MNGHDRIERIKFLIEHNEGCNARHIESAHIRELFEGEREPMWEGMVETFQLENHPAAKRAYGWMRGQMGEPQREREYTYLLGVQPINSAQDAVKAAVAVHVKAKLKELKDL